MNNWRKISLGDIISVNVSSYSARDDWNFVNYLDTSNITGNIINKIQRIDLKKESLPSRARRKTKFNSIIYSTVRPNQRHYGIIKSQIDNFLVSTGFVVIDVLEQFADADFIYFFLTQDDIVNYLHALAEQSTSAYPSIKSSDIENLEIALPQIQVQKKISAILRCLSQKILYNKAINDNLAA